MEVPKNLPKIGWIGTGVMGFHMCKHLLDKKYPMSVFNRTKSKAEPLINLGAQWSLPNQMAKQVDIMIVMLGYPKDIQDVCLGEDGLIKHMKPGQLQIQLRSILIDHTTSKPSLAKTLYEQCHKKQISSIDAPVSGGDIGARNGKLVTMCGGDTQTMQKATHIMNCYSQAVHHHGTAGKGQQAKLTNQIVLANNMAGVVQGLMFASKMNLDLKKVIDTISSGGAQSTALKNLGTRIVDGDLQPGFYVEHYIKDMEIALEQAQRVGLTLPCFEIIKQLYVKLKEQGCGKLGSQALIKVLEDMNNYKIHK